MTEHVPEESLHEHVEGGLSEGKRASTSAHLADCADCRRTVEELSRVRVALAKLDREIHPPRDLWPIVAGRLSGAGAKGDEAKQPLDLGPQRKTPRKGTRTRLWARTIWVAAAAAALFVFLLVGGMAFEIKVGSDQVHARFSMGKALEARDLSRAAFAPSETEYEQAMDDLLRALEARRESMGPETTAVLERNLAIIDRAIQDTRDALARDPASRDLAFLLCSAYDAKLELLREAAGIPDQI